MTAPSEASHEIIPRCGGSREDTDRRRAQIDTESGWVNLPRSVDGRFADASRCDEKQANTASTSSPELSDSVGSPTPGPYRVTQSVLLVSARVEPGYRDTNPSLASDTSTSRADWQYVSTDLMGPSTLELAKSRVVTVQYPGSSIGRWRQERWTNPTSLYRIIPRGERDDHLSPYASSLFVTFRCPARRSYSGGGYDRDSCSSSTR